MRDLEPLSMVATLDLRWGRKLPLYTFFRDKERLEAAGAPANLLHSGKHGLYLRGFLLDVIDLIALGESFVIGRGSLLNLLMTSSLLDVVALGALERDLLLNLPKASSLLDQIALGASFVMGRGSLLNLPKTSSLLDLIAFGALLRGSLLILPRMSSLLDLIIEAHGVSLEMAL